MTLLDDERTLQAGWIERQDAGRLRLRGNDRRSYLHGLLTNDVASLSPGAGVYAALLTPQGRMISDMHVYELGDAVIITLPRPLASSMRDRLDQFIFSEDVQVEDITASSAQLGVYGPAAAAAVEPLRATDAVLPSRDFGIEGFEVITAAERRADVIASLEAAGAKPVAMDTLEVARVEAGIPRFLVDMTDTTIPLEAGIEERAISMTKGCYPGQEVIVRVLHRGGGRVARKLVGLVMDSEDVVPSAGAPLRDGDREIGALTSVVHSSRLGRAIGLGYVHRDYAAHGTTVQIAGPSGHPVSATVHSLPIIPSGS